MVGGLVGGGRNNTGGGGGVGKCGVCPKKGCRGHVPGTPQLEGSVYLGGGREERGCEGYLFVPPRVGYRGGAVADWEGPCV